MGVPNGFNAAKDLPSLEGKVIFVTGGTAGLGSVSIQALAKHNPAHLYFTGRNAKRAHLLIAEIKKTAPNAQMTFIECDFESLSSIRAGMKHFTHSSLDILICNAGIMAKPPQLSKDGYELQFAVNHLAHALVIKLLFPALLEAASKPTPDARIVLLTSVGWRGHPKGGIQISKLNTVQDFSVFGSWQRYGQSKLANIIYAKELARRYPTITSVSVHPGVVKTDLVGDLGCADKLLVYATNLWQTVEKEEGALNQLWMAAGAKKGDIMNGAFYLPVGIESNATLDKNAQNVDLGKELWEWTESVLGKF